ncbi:DNA-binding transcriptional MerR regulator [Streptomyces griseochromogenes]|uniref:DNA-binding transcriptional MerR regulator n=1 Tax=Streptomyces griseochromogenes TaxID=68214 RepID=A0A1B1B597_9ACTN|nr:MerR family transcriptional regulator [Streptomyces griseochromogenes]ANP53995.1 MerR family transcriptional regulator [Streptomyces griseochromogenes]MBP2052286.1 DNA-binding transcriptional MerR regulator [Streptomyces griseochromogenes]
MTSGQPLPRDPEPSLTIAQVAERTGLTHDTLRYYEKAGLIERIGRTTGNQRRYQATDLAWLEFLLRLRETGMSIADMQRFARLRSEGDPTVADRLAMLREHRAELADRIRALRRNAAALDDKIDHYERLLDERRPGTDEPT